MANNFSLIALSKSQKFTDLKELQQSNLKVEASSRQPEYLVERIEFEDPSIKKSLDFGHNMQESFVLETEAHSSKGAHLKTSKIGAELSYEFVGTGVRFLTKKGSGAGLIDIFIDDQLLFTANEYVSGSPQFQVSVFEKFDLSLKNAKHTIRFVTKAGDQGNFNFDALEIFSLPKPLIQALPGATYYVDSSVVTSGDGLSEQKAFKSLADINSLKFGPGNKILLKRDTCYQGQLYVHGSGSVNNPLIISDYGEGEKLPLIDGGGLAGTMPKYGENGPFGQAGSVVYLLNSEYVEISNLHIKNTNHINTDTETSGIRIEAAGGGVYKHLVVRNCEIEQIRGTNGQSYSLELVPPNGGTTFYVSRVTHRTGGINILSYTKRGAQANDHRSLGEILDPVPTRFDDVLIENNYIHDCVANGITTSNVNGDLDSRDNRHTNVIIRNNKIQNVSRSGIINLYTDGALIEGNHIDRFQTITGGWGCGIWADRANNMIYRGNEICNGVGTSDGMAMNLDDMTENGIVEGNYTHNNVGGGIMLHVRTNSYNRNHTIRYNLSVNDTKNFADHQAVIVAVGEDSGTKIENAHVYNNTFVNNHDVHPIFKGDQVEYVNNIFEFTHPQTATRQFAYLAGANSTFKQNLFTFNGCPKRLENGNFQSKDALYNKLTGNDSFTAAMEILKQVNEAADLPIVFKPAFMTKAESDIFKNVVGEREKVRVGADLGKYTNPNHEISVSDELDAEFKITLTDKLKTHYANLTVSPVLNDNNKQALKQHVLQISEINADLQAKLLELVKTANQNGANNNQETDILECSGFEFVLKDAKGVEVQTPLPEPITLKFGQLFSDLKDKVVEVYHFKEPASHTNDLELVPVELVDQQIIFAAQTFSPWLFVLKNKQTATSDLQPSETSELYEKLQTLIAQGENLDISVYTKESYAKLQAALTQAKAITQKSAEAEVEIAYKELDEALKNLQKVLATEIVVTDISSKQSESTEVPLISKPVESQQIELTDLKSLNSSEYSDNLQAQRIKYLVTSDNHLSFKGKAIPKTGEKTKSKTLPTLLLCLSLVISGSLLMQKRIARR